MRHPARPPPPRPVSCAAQPTRPPPPRLTHPPTPPRLTPARTPTRLVLCATLLRRRRLHRVVGAQKGGRGGHLPDPRAPDPRPGARGTGTGGVRSPQAVLRASLTLLPHRPPTFTFLLTFVLPKYYHFLSVHEPERGRAGGARARKGAWRGQLGPYLRLRGPLCVVNDRVCASALPTRPRSEPSFRGQPNPPTHPRSGLGNTRAIARSEPRVPGSRCPSCRCTRTCRPGRPRRR